MVNCGAPHNTLDPISQGAGNVNHYPGILPNSFYKDSDQSAHRFCGEPEFNCTNHPNFGDPNLTLTANAINSSTLQPVPGTGAFGTVTSTRGGIFMRELLFALKLCF